MSQPIRVLLDTTITFDAGDRIVHSPMVLASANGIVTKLILDTGSTDHVLTIEYAREVGLRSTPSEPGTDHAGALVPSWSLGDVPIQISDSPFALRDVVAINGPTPFETWGVGGFLSPQNLHPTAWVVIDLRGDNLLLVEGDDSSVASWLEERWPALRRLALKREQGDALLVQAAIEPFDDVTAMLNTGSSGTEFARAAVQGLRGKPPEDIGFGVSSAEVHGEEVAGQVLRVGSATMPVPVLLVREEMPPEHPPGIVGMDVARGSVIAVSADANEPVYWLVPRAGKVVQQRPP